MGCRGPQKYLDIIRDARAARIFFLIQPIRSLFSDVIARLLPLRSSLCELPNQQRSTWVSQVPKKRSKVHKACLFTLAGSILGLSQDNCASRNWHLMLLEIPAKSQKNAKSANCLNFFKKCHLNSCRKCFCFISNKTYKLLHYMLISTAGEFTYIMSFHLLWTKRRRTQN